MEANELMIGDWIQDSMDNDEKWQWEKEDFLYIDIDEIEPVPITEEILQKNGFEQVEDGRKCEGIPEGIWQNERNLYGIDYNHRGMFYTFSHDPEEDGLIDKIYGIFYVHELQHALRLCGLNNLAHDFKV